MKAYNIRYEKPIVNWDEALPLGDGKLGCLIYGDGPLHLTLDRVDLWDSRPHPVPLEKGFNYAHLLRLVKSGDEQDWTEYERLFDKICCVSKSSRISFIKRYPKLADNTTTIFNLINHQDIRLSAKEKIKDVNFTNDCFSIMSTGRISYQKQFTIIPDIAKQIADKFKFKWYIIGDGPERCNLERKIKEYDLEETVILLGKQDNPYKYLARTNLYALTSLYESYPTVINEALVLNIPIISNDIPSIYEMIDETQGVIAPIEKWAKILCEIIGKGDLGKHEYNIDFESFNQDVMTKFYELIEL